MLTTKEIITNYFEYVNSRQWDKWLDLFDENVILDGQLFGHIEGKTKLAEVIVALRSNEHFRNYPLEVVVEGDKAMVVWNEKNSKSDGTPIDLKGANLYKIRNGKIVYFSNFHDTTDFK